MKRQEEIVNKAKEEAWYIADTSQTKEEAAIGGYCLGAAYADRTMLERAKEYLENNIDEDLIIYYNNTWKKRDEFIKDFIRAMEGGAE